MEEGLLRVREYAALVGCTPQNIYGHLRTYESELNGHVYRGKGRQGLLLDRHAQDFLRTVMYPKELTGAAAAEEIDELRQQLMQLGLTNMELASKLATVEGERDRALLEAGENQRLLLASREAEEARALELAAAQERAEQLEGDLKASEARYVRMMQRGPIARLLNREVE